MPNTCFTFVHIEFENPVVVAVMLKKITQPHHQVALAKCQQSRIYKEAEEKIVKEI